MKKTTKTLLTATAITGGILGYKKLVDDIFGDYFKAKNDIEDKDIEEVIPAAIADQYEKELPNLINWFTSLKREEKEITSFDGLKLSGMHVTINDSNKLMILVHGLNSERYTLLKQAYEFSLMGYNLLMVDQRGCGASLGSYVTYGLKESIDLLQWISSLVKENENIEIGLYGVSMGAATILMTLNSSLPKNVKFAIADSSYASLEDMTSKLLFDKVGILEPFILPSLKLKLKQTLGFDMESVSPRIALAHNDEVPVLLIHSRNDKLIPYHMAEELFGSCLGYKKIIIEENPTHAYACYEDPHYFEKIQQFINMLPQEEDVL